jgi:integrase
VTTKISTDNNKDNSITKYINTIRAMSNSTSKEYQKRLRSFNNFVMLTYNRSTDILIKGLVDNHENPYDILSGYVNYLQANNGLSALTLKQHVITAKNFLEYHDIEISPRKFKFKVKLPKAVRKNKEALTKEDIIDILNACSDIRLKTYMMLLASTGIRAKEALSTRECDYDLEADPPRVLIRGEYTKTKVDRIVYLTNEVVKQMKTWLEYKYRTRRICYFDKNVGKTKCEYRTPAKNNKHLIFSVNQLSQGDPSLESMYVIMSNAFAKTLDRMGKGEREDDPRKEDIIGKRRRKITFHSCRRWVKSTISDLGYGDYSEYFIGHIGSTYYRKSVKEKAEIFRKIEPYLTFLDFAQLERKGADVKTRVEELEVINQKLRERDSMNTDAIASLSDQLTKVIQEIEVLKKHQK